MSGTNINIRVKTKAEQATSALSGLTKTMKGLSRQGSNTSKTMSALVGNLGSLKRLSQGFGIHKTAGAMATATKAASDITESIHMFNVSMGELAVSTGKAVGELSELSGIDRITMLDTVGEYNLLARSMGMASDSSAVLAENTNKLALDLSALTNREYSKVADDLRSGLIGQARTMYKYGVDVTEVAIQQEALNQGLTKSVRAMNQGEKMALRYSVIMKQTGLAHGDFAETAHTTANSIRILNSRFLELTRSIGTLFLPLLEKILPYLHATVIAVDRVVKSFIDMLGISNGMNKIANTTSDFGLEELADDADNSSKSIKELERQLMGFDEINLYREDKGQGVLDEVDDSGGLGDFELKGYDNKLTEANKKTQEIADSIIGKFNDIKKAAEPTTTALGKLWDEGLSDLKDFTGENLINFYNKFLKPVGEFTLGDKGLARLINVLNDMLSSLDWDGTTDALSGLFEAMVKPAEFVITAFVDRVKHYLVPIWEWKFEEGIPRFANVLKNVFEKIDWDTINVGLTGFWDALARIEILKMEAFMWLMENILEPLGIWMGNTLAPKTLELLTKALETLERILIVLKPTWTWFWEDVIIPLGEKLGVEMIDGMDSLIDKLEQFAVWAETNPETFNDMAQTFIKFGASFMALTPVVGLAGKIAKSMLAFKGAKTVYDFFNTDFSELLGTGSASDVADSLIGKPADLRAEVIKRMNIVDEAGKFVKSAEAPLDKTRPFMISSADMTKGTIKAKDIVDPGLTGKVTGMFSNMGKSVSGIFGNMSTVMSNAFAIPGVKIAVIATAIAAAAYLIYDNWDSIKGLFITIWDTIKPILESTKDLMMGLWEEVIQPLWEYLKPVIVELMDILGKVFRVILSVLGKLFEAFGPVIKGAIDALATILIPVLGTIVDVIGGLLGILKGVFKVINGILEWDLNKVLEGFGDILDGVYDTVTAYFKNIPELFGGMMTAIKGLWGGWVSSLPGAFGDIMRSVEDFGKNLWKKIKDWFDSLNISDWISEKFEKVKDFSPSSYIKDKVGSFKLFGGPSTASLTMAPIPQLAGGGLVDAGQMFIANEAGPEMVGKYGSKTGVVNNEQIVSAISEGVYRAVTSASMGNQDDSGGGEAVMNIDGRELARIILPHMNRESKRQGYKPILQY